MRLEYNINEMYNAIAEVKYHVYILCVRSNQKQILLPHQ